MHSSEHGPLVVVYKIDYFVKEFLLSFLVLLNTRVVLLSDSKDFSSWHYVYYTLSDIILLEPSTFFHMSHDLWPLLTLTLCSKNRKINQKENGNKNKNKEKLSLPFMNLTDRSKESSKRIGYLASRRKNSKI